MVVCEFAARFSRELFPYVPGLAGHRVGRMQTIELHRFDKAVSTAFRRHSSPAPTLDEFPLERLLKTFGVKGRKP